MQPTRNRNALLRPSGFFTAVVFILIVLLIVFNETIGGYLGKFVSVVSVSKVDVYESLPKNVLASRLLDAEEELSQIRYQSLLYTLEVEEHKALRDSLGLLNEDVFLRGSIISRPPRTHYGTFLVSYDASKDLSEGDLAFVSGIYIGQVFETKNGIATISLLSSPNTAFDVRVGDPSAIVIMRGLGGGAFTFDIPKEVSLSSGDIISTGSGDPYVVGIVSSILEVPENTTSRVYATSPVNVNSARIVEFIKAQKQ